ncbi:carboxypeptidase regulatory-like domain-containing protein [Telmatobacter bradus]|uniref:carboxypeptidase regulatory-like domain-containing protein n=1 Tax=Telmatobacter bradus TaxID=474953 RepID=UPI003B428010
MPTIYGKIFRLFSLFVVVGVALQVHAAQGGNAGSVRGSVTDPSGAVIPGASVHLSSSISGLSRTATSGADGQFEIANIPFATYRLNVSAAGFAATSQSVDLRSVVGSTVKVILQIASSSTTVTVESSGDLVENDPTFHTDVDRDLFLKVPLESQSSSLSALVTQTTPGVAADSNGLFHGLGDHASNSFSVDGQSITDQQSKVFSNQIPSDSIQSLQVISGAPPAEYGGKTSLVIVATTRSGQGINVPTGSIGTSYGSFGSTSGNFDISYGGKDWGNFFEADALNTGRFLDPPEFKVFHAKGNEQNFFDRIDRTLTQVDSMHLDLNFSRSWFQTPNAYDNLNVQNVVSGGTTADPVYANVGNTDQHSEIKTFNVSPTYTRIVNDSSVLNVGAFVRRDEYHYYPSGNPLADLGPTNLQTSSIKQSRTLTNAAVHADISYAHGIHSVKAGVQYGQTFLRENDWLGVVDAELNAPCVDASGASVAGLSSTAQCATYGYSVNSAYLTVLAPYDLTRGGSDYYFHGQTDVKELALYAEDQIKAGNWLFNLGLREDIYNGLTKANQLEPRVGIAYNVKPSATVLRASYARTLETPFNENLVLSSNGCADAVLSPLLSCSSGVSSTMAPGYRNEFHAGFQQGIHGWAVVSGEYIWKYTHNAFDFSVLGNTPITFPIDWHNAKIPGWAMNVSVPERHNFSAYVVMSSVAARFFNPQVAGAGATVATSNSAFRIDHDEKYNQDTHLQYQFGRRGPWVGWNWRYDSGMVSGSVPYATSSNGTVDLSGLTYDQQAQAGLTCGGVEATRTKGFSSCAASQYGSTLVSIPAPGTENDDKNPPRIAPRNLFDASLGKQNIFRANRYKVDLTLTAINLTNKYAPYNFLSTFSGTHYVTPRDLSAKVSLNF